MTLIWVADTVAAPDSHVQNWIIVHYDTQEHTSQGVCCRIEPIYEPIGLQPNSKYEGAVI